MVLQTKYILMAKLNIFQKKINFFFHDNNLQDTYIYKTHDSSLWTFVIKEGKRK